MKRSMKRAGLVLLGGLLVTGCATTTPEAELPLAIIWQVEWLGERPLVDRSRLTLTLDPSGRAYGSGGCNRWFGQHELGTSELSIEPRGATRMACAPALMEQEQRYLNLLETVVRWDRGPNGELQLWPREGEPIKLWQAEEQE